MFFLNQFKLFRIICGGTWYKYLIIFSDYTSTSFWSLNSKLEKETEESQVIIVDIERYDCRF